jgi:hypothetical protein
MKRRENIIAAALILFIFSALLAGVVGDAGYSGVCIAFVVISVASAFTAIIAHLETPKS